MSTTTVTRGGAESPTDPGWAWDRYEPSGDRPWSLGWAGHLFRRAAFGANGRQLREALAQGPQRTIDRILNPQASPAIAALDADEEAALGAGGVNSLRAWWLRRMLESPHPLREKLTLFWHGHFGLSMSRVKDPQLMSRHLRMLRAHALGSYRDLLQAASRDPAMYVGLNAEASRKAIPNENLARQVMGGLSLGPGACDEQDVKEAARAFTGWFVLRGGLRFFEREHDSGVKTVLKQQGPWQAADVVRIVLDRREAAHMLVRKLYRWFISDVDDPADALLEPLAQSFAESYDTGRLVETMLRSNLFFSSVAYRRRIKSPVDFALGIVTGLEGMAATTPLGAALADLGQALCEPPTVRGWPGGSRWLNAVTISGRLALAHALLSSEGAYGGKPDPALVAETSTCQNPEAAIRLFQTTFLQDDLAAESERTLRDVARVLQNEPREIWLRKSALAVVSLPDFQLC